MADIYLMSGCAVRTNIGNIGSILVICVTLAEIWPTPHPQLPNPNPNPHPQLPNPQHLYLALSILYLALIKICLTLMNIGLPQP